MTRARIASMRLPPIIEVDRHLISRTQPLIGTQVIGVETTWRWAAHLTTYLNHTLKNRPLSLRVFMLSMETDVKTAPHAANSKRNRHSRTRNRWTGGMMTTSGVLSVDPPKRSLSNRRMHRLTDMTMAAVDNRGHTC